MVLAALAWCVAALFVGGAGAAFRSLGATLVGAAGAAVLLIPWTGTAAHGLQDPSAFGFTVHPDVQLSQLVRFHTGPAGAGIAGYGLLAAAALALLLATGPRLAWVVRAWALILAAWAAVLVPARLAPGLAVPPPEAVLSLGALGIALAAGLAVASRPAEPARLAGGRRPRRHRRRGAGRAGVRRRRARRAVAVPEQLVAGRAGLHPRPAVPGPVPGPLDR